jgi:CMP-N-acetylneuraminic acid synthetase/spore coat polysaccharide biosynthesis predicted glycosyltransferase SpsG
MISYIIFTYATLNGKESADNCNRFKDKKIWRYRMRKHKNILIIIPARGGSKGIARKNLRSLNGKPLISYSIRTALNSRYKPDVYVSSDDEEILFIAEQLGAKVHKRSMENSLDAVTLDPVIFEALNFISLHEKKCYDIIVTMQPTSPLLSTQSLDSAITILLKRSDIDTVIAAKDDTHLTWKKENSVFFPNYEERVNRQFLKQVFKETGGFLITRAGCVSDTNRIGKAVELYLLEKGEDIDIDSYMDWNLCEYYLRRKKILFVISGYTEIGLGHVENALTIANDILNHEIQFLVDSKSQLALNKILERNYPVKIQKHSDILKDIEELGPDIVINDKLDTSIDYILGLKNMGVRVINFEDLGEGASVADIVINAMYPEKTPRINHFFGPNYFCLSDEFLYSKQKTISNEVRSILLSFGNVDPNNYTQKVLDAIYDFCAMNSIKINVVTGFSYLNYESLKKYNKINILENLSNVAEHMREADVIFTSEGRTIYEAASIGTPTIVLAHNPKEMTHFFTSWQYGFLNLGFGIYIFKEEILASFQWLVEHPEMREFMSSMMNEINIRGGRSNVIKLIKQVVENNEN